MKPECHAGTQRGAPVEANDPRMGPGLQRAVGAGGETRSHGLAWTELSKPEQEDTEFQGIRSTETWIEVRCQENTAPRGPLEETAALALH